MTSHMDLPPMRSLDVVDFEMRFSRPLIPSDAVKLRGHFGQTYPEETLMHHHRPDGGLIYDYPCVQFKVLDRAAHLLGIEDGCAIVIRLWGDTDFSRLGQETVAVLDSNLRRRSELVGVCDDWLEYEFISPWIGLNQENHRKFDDCRNDRERTVLLEKILAGNCLSLAKAFHIFVNTRLEVHLLDAYDLPINLKGATVLGFKGRFAVNFHIPHLFGIGKAGSRGFGTVGKILQTKGRI